MYCVSWCTIVYWSTLFAGVHLYIGILCVCWCTIVYWCTVYTGVLCILVYCVCWCTVYALLFLLLRDLCPLPLLRDGTGLSGAFAQIISQIERMKVEGLVDFFQSIKLARLQRAHLVYSLVCTLCPALDMHDS